MQLLRNLISRVTTLWTLYGVVTKINTALKSYPGTGDEIRLRAWLLDHLALLAGLAARSGTPIDDTVVYYTLRIIENDVAWKIIFNMLTLTDSLTTGTSETIAGNATGTMSFADEGQPDCFLALYEIEKTLHLDTTVGTQASQTENAGNPMLIISAVGLLLQIIQFLRKK